MSKTHTMYTLIMRKYISCLPTSVYLEDHWVYNNLDSINMSLERLKSINSDLTPIRIEESCFNKHGALVCKKVLKVFDEEVLNDTDEVED